MWCSWKNKLSGSLYVFKVEVFLPLAFSDEQLFNWNNKVMNCFAVNRPAEFYTCINQVCVYKHQSSRSKRTYKSRSAVQSNWFCFIRCALLVERTTLDHGG